MSALTADEPAVLPLARQPPRTAALPSFPSPITMRHRADSTADSTAEWLANSQQHSQPTSEVVATALRLCSSARRAAAPNTWPRSRGRWAAHTRPPARMGAELREWRQRRSETIVSRQPPAASGSDSRGGAGRGCQSSTRGVAVVTACFGRLCCGARSSFAPSASTASSTRRSVTKTNIISKYTTYLWGPGRPPAVGNLLPAEPLVGTNPQDNSARAPSR